MQLRSVELLAKLVAFDTTSHKSNLPLVQWVAEHLADLGVEAELSHNHDGTKANLFATLGPRDIGGICLHGHTDVVPVKGQPWHSDPFLLTERDGLLYGRGTCDMKAWTACSLAAVEQLHGKTLRTPLHIALSYDEEIGCLGAPELIRRFGVTLPKPVVAFVGEPSMMEPITAHKGIIALDTVITGRDAHASLLHLGVSAIAAAAEAAAELHQLAAEWMKWEGPDGMRPPGPTLNVGQFSGGVARNVIAREARLAWELRFRASDDPDELLDRALARMRARIQQRFGDDFAALSIQTREVARVPAFDAGAGGIAERLARHCGARGQARGVPYGAEAGQYAAAGISTAICGPGNIEQAHQPNEFVAQTQVADCDAFLARLCAWAADNDPPEL